MPGVSALVSQPHICELSQPDSGHGEPVRPHPGKKLEIFFCMRRTSVLRKGMTAGRPTPQIGWGTGPPLKCAQLWGQARRPREESQTLVSP